MSVNDCISAIFRPQRYVSLGLTPPNSPDNGVDKEEEMSMDDPKFSSIYFEPRVEQDFPQASGYLQKEKIWRVTKNTDRESLCLSNGRVDFNNSNTMLSHEVEQTEPLCLAKPKAKQPEAAPTVNHFNMNQPRPVPELITMLMPTSAQGLDRDPRPSLMAILPSSEGTVATDPNQVTLNE